MIRVAVGSLNPVKISAAERAFKKVFGTVVVKPVRVDSGISPQPFSDEEMVLGAITRARNSFEETQADYGVGMEGGIVKYSFGVYVKGWVAVYNGERYGISSTIALPVPDFIWEKLISREVSELEVIMENLSGIKKIGDKIGAFGFFTKNHYDRAKAFEDAIICALAPFMSPEYYREPET